MELSELVVFHDDVLTVCDKTGIVFKGSPVCFRIKVITYFILCQVDLYPLVDCASKLFKHQRPKSASSEGILIALRHSGRWEWSRKEGIQGRMDDSQSKL